LVPIFVVMASTSSYADASRDTVPGLELEQLRGENQRLRRENEDLHIALTTIAEHGDMVESLLTETNVKLKAEIAERQRAEAKLHNLLHLISRQKEDLEIIVQTIMEHGDVVDAQWRQKFCEANQLINLDGLTQVANRRHFDQHLEDQWQKLGERGEPLALVFADVDYFKEFNDFYGHLSGDDCLRRLAKALSACLRNPFDLFARYGGEEFIAILPNTDQTGAYQTARRMQATLELLAIPHHPSPLGDWVTMSFGVAVLIPQPERNPKDLVALADRCLYQAKTGGKNRIICADQV
jgi:diguanylate cyclase (GGDEF)-like protein